MINVREALGGEWFALLSEEFKKPYMEKIGKLLAAAKNVQPAMSDIFRVYNECPDYNVRVIIIGQDPYYNGTADGLAFSTRSAKVPASLKVIFKELERTGFGIRTNPDLSDWVAQGVFLINTALTTTLGNAGAHSSWGWQQFTGATIRYLTSTYKNLVVMAWGKPAQDMAAKYVQDNNHLVLKGSHPAAGLYNPRMNFDNNHFVLANEYLTSLGTSHEVNQIPIKWV